MAGIWDIPKNTHGQLGPSPSEKFFSQFFHLRLFFYQIAFGCKTPSLSDRSVFPRFYRLAPSEGATIPMFLDLMYAHGWTKIALIHEAQEYWSMVCMTFC